MSCFSPVYPDCSPIPENLDHRLRHYEFVLERKDTENIPNYELPEGFRFVYYEDGNKKEWIEIEKSVKELRDDEEGEKQWAHYYAGHEEELKERMFFIENAKGEKVATATAFYEPKDATGAGWLHWVAVRKDAQGQGLARPLISHTLHRLVELGYTTLKIPTHTTNWCAVKLYLDFGFHPIPTNAIHSREGYRIIRTLTNHPSLQEFPPLPYEEIWKKEEM